MYKIQWKGWFLWNTWGSKGFDIFKGEWDTQYIYYTKEDAIKALVKMIQTKENKINNKKASGTVLEIDSKDVKEKLTEYFV